MSAPVEKSYCSFFDVIIALFWFCSLDCFEIRQGPCVSRLERSNERSASCDIN